MFNNGFNNFYPYQSLGSKQGIFSILKGKFNWSSILTNTQKTLNIINQAIPVFYQVKPIWNNTKTIFKIMGALKDDDKKPSIPKSYKNKNSVNPTLNIQKNNFENNNAPSFFL